jgi:hypothetical protein
VRCTRCTPPRRRAPYPHRAGWDWATRSTLRSRRAAARSRRRALGRSR